MHACRSTLEDPTASSAWTRAVGAPAGYRVLELGDSGLAAIVEDVERWNATPTLVEWFKRRSPEQVWEITAGHVVGYAPGELTDAVAGVLPAAADELARIVADSMDDADRLVPTGARSGPAVPIRAPEMGLPNERPKSVTSS